MKRVVSSILLLLALVACEAPEPVEPANPALEPGRHVYTTADGIEMPYVVSGAGETTVFLVHCWMCDRSFWERQLPALEPNYRVIAVDLAGHGEASQQRDAWTVMQLGEDVGAMLNELELNDTYLVGHSMGGAVVLRAAAVASGRVEGVVGVDTLQSAEQVLEGPMMDQILAMFAEDFRGACNQMVQFMFVEGEPAEIKDEINEKSCAGGNAEAGFALMQDYGNVDFPALFRDAGVPIRGINAVSESNPTTIEINRKYADFDAILMEGVGHYLHMTRPEEFNAHLLQTLADLQAGEREES